MPDPLASHGRAVQARQSLGPPRACLLAEQLMGLGKEQGQRYGIASDRSRLHLLRPCIFSDGHVPSIDQKSR